ncbi:MAG TPA: hypothetical protein VGW12_05775 [Pyrinomonadaceae bacterium]|nr:hypothetical protein [Pyrinomonadaceae bacterium]
MEETQKVFEPAPLAERDETIVNEPDATLATPRFDEVEAQVARPVVPLGARPARLGGRRQWPIALVLISALAGGVVSILAFRLYQQRQQQQTQVSATEVQARTPQDASETTASPAPTPEAASDEQAQADAPVVFEEFDPAKEGDRVTDAAPSRPKATVTDAAPPARNDEAKDEARDNSKPSPRLVETIKSPRTQSAPAPRQIEARHEDVLRREDERAGDDDFYERRRERRRQRREQRREQRRNIDRIKDIFEGTPPG